MDKSVKVILVLIAIGLFANAFAPVVEIREAQAQVDCATSDELHSATKKIIATILAWSH